MSVKLDLVKSEKARADGNTAFKKGRWNEAIGEYTTATIYNPQDHLAYSNRAQAYLKLDKFDDAERDCTASLEIARSVKAFYRRGSARRGLGKLEEAIADYEQVVQLEPGNETVRAELEEVRAEKRKMDDKNAKPPRRPVTPPGSQPRPRQQGQDQKQKQKQNQEQEQEQDDLVTRTSSMTLEHPHSQSPSHSPSSSSDRKEGDATRGAPASSSSSGASAESATTAERVVPTIAIAGAAGSDTDTGTGAGAVLEKRAEAKSFSSLRKARDTKKTFITSQSSTADPGSATPTPQRGGDLQSRLPRSPDISGSAFQPDGSSATTSLSSSSSSSASTTPFPPPSLDPRSTAPGAGLLLLRHLSASPHHNFQLLRLYAPSKLAKILDPILEPDTLAIILLAFEYGSYGSGSSDQDHQPDARGGEDDREWVKDCMIRLKRTKRWVMNVRMLSAREREAAGNAWESSGGQGGWS